MQLSLALWLDCQINSARKVVLKWQKLMGWEAVKKPLLRYKVVHYKNIESFIIQSDVFLVRALWFIMRINEQWTNPKGSQFEESNFYKTNACQVKHTVHTAYFKKCIVYICMQIINNQLILKGLWLLYGEVYLNMIRIQYLCGIFRGFESSVRQFNVIINLHFYWSGEL